MPSISNAVVRYLSNPANHPDLWRIIARVHWWAPFVVEEDELFQEVALRALRAGNQFDGNSYGQFLGWFAAIARRRLIDYVRNSTRTPSEVESTEDVPAQGDEGSDLNEIRDYLENVFSQLTPMEAALLRARHVAGFSFEQIARLINKKPNAVRKTHSRLLKRLRIRYSKNPR